MPVTINGTTGIVSPNYTGNGSVPTGSVYHFASSTAPTGFLICNGDAVPNGSGTVQSITADFSALYSILGTTYGVAGTLPDLRGYFVRSSGTNADGTASGTFGTKQADGVISHTHSGTTGNDSPDHTHTTQPTNGSGGSGVNATTGGAYAGTNTGGASTRHQHPFTTSSQSPAGATETRPKNIALLPCIKY
jgi:microcystin-dependent protein